MPRRAVASAHRLVTRRRHPPAAASRRAGAASMARSRRSFARAGGGNGGEHGMRDGVSSPCSLRMEGSFVQLVQFFAIARERCCLLIQVIGCLGGRVVMCSLFTEMFYPIQGSRGCRWRRLVTAGLGPVCEGNRCNSRLATDRGPMLLEPGIEMLVEYRGSRKSC